MLAKLLSIIALSALAAPVLGQTQPSISQLVNGNFETCSNGTAPSGWQQEGSGTNGQPIVVCSSDRFHSGSLSARFVPFVVTNQGQQTTYVAEISQTVTILEAGQPVTLSYWVNFAGVPVGLDPSTRGTYNFTVTYNNDANSRISIDPQFVPGTGTPADNNFFQFRTTFNAPNDGSRNGTLTIAFQSNQPSIDIYVDDVTLTAPLIAGDPSFVGLRGQKYQVHGIADAVYNLLSSTNTQVNSRFVFLDVGSCPIIDGIPAVNCWSHPGSYLGEIGVQQRVNGRVHTAVIVAGDAKQGFASVVVDGKPLKLSEYVAHTAAFNVSFDSAYRVTVKTEEFVFKFDNSDMFINQAVWPRVSLGELSSHGLFGQTHKAAHYPTALKFIAGQVDDYMIQENDLFGTEFMYNQFKL